MAYNDQVCIWITSHATYNVTANDLDRAIARYLPGSPYGLRQKLDAHPRNSFLAGHFDDLTTVSEYLLVLAYLDSSES